MLPEIQVTRCKHGGFELRAEQVLARQPREIFSFFSDAANLERITPAFLNFRVLTKPPIAIEEGTVIDYRLRLHGIPFSWRTRIRSWSPPHRFIDEQLRGPYRRWVHEHTFESCARGTLARDRVEYQVIGGALVNWLIVERDVKRIFEYRRYQLHQRFGT